MTTKAGRNDPCPCGSGQKYKRCCATKDAAARSAELLADAEARTAALAAEAEAEAEAQDAGEGAGEPAQDKTAQRPKRPKLPTSHNSPRSRGV